MGQWYGQGLDFECVLCGRCCSGGPGVVLVDAEEIRRIAAFLCMHPDDLWGRILRRVENGRVSLTERTTGDCVFLERTGAGQSTCSIYPIRPQQCRTWPFWTVNLASRAAWERAAATCRGMNQGRHYDLDRIESIRRARPWHQRMESQCDEAAR